MTLKKISSETIVFISFLIGFGIVGYFYFDSVVYWINYGLWEAKAFIGVEQTRGIVAFKFLPGWANAAFGSIIGWVIRNIIKKIYIKFIKEKFLKWKKRRRNIL